MKRKILYACCVFLAASSSYAQVGINNEVPKATLHVAPSNTGSSTAEGIIAPNLTRSQLISKDAQYTTDHKGALVYVTDLSGTLTTKTTKVTDIGYYYFDGTAWEPIGGKVSLPTEPWLVQGAATDTEATSNTENIYQMGSVAIGAKDAETNMLLVKGNATTDGDHAVTGSATVTNKVSTKDLETTGGLTSIDGVIEKLPDGTATKGLVIKNMEEIPDARVVVYNVNNGLIGSAPSIPEPVLYVQKRGNQYIEGTELTNFNKDVSIPVKWSTQPMTTEGGFDFSTETSDIITNNLKIQYNQSEYAFEFMEGSDGLYEITGYVNYIARAANAAALNVKLEIMTNGSSTWQMVTGSRLILSSPGNAQSVMYAPAIVQVKEGDKIRLTVSNPGVADAHGTGGPAGVLRPVGLKYLASMKINALGG